MNLFVTVIVLLGIAAQVSQVSAKACTSSGNECTGVDNTVTAKTCEDGKCKCQTDFVPTRVGCGTTLDTPEITGEKEVGKLGDLSLVCGSDSETKEMTYEWKKDNEKIENATNKTYSVKDVTEKYQGDYVCTTKIESRTADSAKFKVDVIGGVSQVAGSLLVVFAAALVSRLF